MGEKRTGTIGLVQIRPPMSREDEVAALAHIAEGRTARQEMKVHEILTPAERQRLKRLTARGRRAEAELLSSTLGLVRQQVNQLGFRLDRDELELAGVQGLVEALYRFDQSQGNRFATYAHYWIRKLVFEAISSQAMLSDSMVRDVIAYRRLLQKKASHNFRVSDVMRELNWTRPRASRVIDVSMSLGQDLGTSEHPIEELGQRSEAPSLPEADWVVDTLRNILGKDFEDFWMLAGKVCSLEEIGQRRGISKQAVAKRQKTWHRKVAESPDGARLLSIYRTLL